MIESFATALPAAVNPLFSPLNLCARCWHSPRYWQQRPWSLSSGGSFQSTTPEGGKYLVIVPPDRAIRASAAQKLGPARQLALYTKVMEMKRKNAPITWITTLALLVSLCAGLTFSQSTAAQKIDREISNTDANYPLLSKYA